MKSNIKRLFSYTLRYKLSFTVSIIGFLIFAAADVAAVEWIRRVIEFINSSDVVNPLFIAIALILIAFARGLGFFIGNYFMSRVGLGIVHDMRNELFNKLIKLPKIYFDNNQKLLCISSAISLIKLLSAEYQKNQFLYSLIDDFFILLKNDDWIKNYIFWELELLKVVGYELKFESLVDKKIVGNELVYFSKSTTDKKKFQIF